MNNYYSQFGLYSVQITLKNKMMNIMFFGNSQNREFMLDDGNFDNMFGGFIERMKNFARNKLTRIRDERTKMSALVSAKKIIEIGKLLHQLSKKKNTLILTL